MEQAPGLAMSLSFAFVIMRSRCYPPSAHSSVGSRNGCLQPAHRLESLRGCHPELIAVVLFRSKFEIYVE